MGDNSKRKIILGMAILLLIIVFILLLILFNKKIIYTVSFDTDGGSIIESIQVYKGDIVNLPDDPVKEGYIFDAWMLGETIFNEGMIIEEDIELKALWVKEAITENIKVSFDTNGGNVVTDIMLLVGQKIESLPVPVKEGYIFKFWNDANGNEIDEEEAFSKDTTLFAVWEKEEKEEEKITCKSGYKLKGNKCVKITTSSKNETSSNSKPTTNPSTDTEEKPDIEEEENKKIECIYNEGATPVQGDTYTDANGIYMYKYKQKLVYDPGDEWAYWQDMDEDGWGVQLIDLESTDAVVEPICSSINGKPVISTSGMYANSQASSIDLSTLDTSNVTDMHAMFAYSEIEELDLSTFNTSNVTDMHNMFFWSPATALDLSSFNTSNVTNMRSMFKYSKATSLDLSTFDTSRVTDMSLMFGFSQATALDLSSFNTSNVTNMGQMFGYSQATALDLSSFDTSKVTNMGLMFVYSQATALDLSSFNTSNVTSMGDMFSNSKATIGYARNSDEADKFNNASVTKIPNTLLFEVKSK